MIDFILPATDPGVLAQVIGVLVIGGVAMVVTRHHREWRLIVVGTTLLLLALMGVRALH